MKLFRRFRSVPDPKTRQVRGDVQALQARRDVQAMQARGDVPGLLDVLSNARWGEGQTASTIRWEAVNALISIDNPQVVRGLLDVLHGSSHLGRAWATVGLKLLVQRNGRVGTEHAIEQLLALVVSGDMEQAAYAASVLAAVPAPEALTPVAQRLEMANRSDDQWRPWAQKSFIQALGAFGDPRGVEPIIEALSFRDKPYRHSKEIEETAAVALGACVDVRETAAIALGTCGDFRAVQPLVDMRIEAQQEGIGFDGFAAQAIQALVELKNRGCLRDPRALPPLVMLTQNRMPPTANFSVRILGEIGNPDAVDALLAALERRDTATAASKALYQYRDPRSIRPLMNAILSGVKIDEDCERWLAYNCVRDDIARLIACVKKEGYFQGVRHPLRLVAARMLMEMYRSGRLDEAFKRLVLAQKRTIEKPHSDSHTDRISRGGPRYDDYSPHEDRHWDEGIGIQFPL